MGEQNNNQPSGYQPTTGNTVGVNNGPTQGTYAQRCITLAPMMTGREVGIMPVKTTPEGTPPH